MNSSSNTSTASVLRPLPALGAGEAYYHAHFEMIGEDAYVEGVVAAEGGSAAASLLLHEEAHSRGKSYHDLLPLACHALTRRLTRDEALILLPKVKHSVSMWKHSAGTLDDAVSCGQAELALD